MTTNSNIETQTITLEAWEITTLMVHLNRARLGAIRSGNESNVRIREALLRKIADQAGRKIRI